MGSKTDLTVWTPSCPSMVYLITPSMVHTFSARLDLEIADSILWEAGVRSSTRMNLFSSLPVGLGRFFLCLRMATLTSLEDTFIMTWGGPSELAAALKGRKQASMTVAAWGTLVRSLAALAATSSGLRMTS